MRMNNSILNRVICFFRNLFKENKRSNSFIIDINDPIIISLCRHAKTRKKVATEYGCSVKTLNRRFEKQNLQIPRGLICHHNLRIIYATLGIPQNIK